MRGSEENLMRKVRFATELPCVRVDIEGQTFLRINNEWYEYTDHCGDFSILKSEVMCRLLDFALGHEFFMVGNVGDLSAGPKDEGVL